MSRKFLVQISTSVKSTNVNEVQILHDCRTDLVVRLNKTASDIWDALVEESSWENTINRFQFKTGCKESEAATVVTEFAMRLQKEGWLFLKEEKLD
jgi:Coenzyme PQQ synthesis protein D (PqqD)